MDGGKSHELGREREIKRKTARKGKYREKIARYFDFVFYVFLLQT